MTADGPASRTSSGMLRRTDARLLWRAALADEGISRPARGPGDGRERNGGRRLERQPCARQNRATWARWWSAGRPSPFVAMSRRSPLCSSACIGRPCAVAGNSNLSAALSTSLHALRQEHWVICCAADFRQEHSAAPIRASRCGGAHRHAAVLMRHRLPRLFGPHPVRSHHLVVLMLDNVAVPDILPRCVKRALRHAGNLAGISNHRVLEAVSQGSGSDEASSRARPARSSSLHRQKSAADSRLGSITS